MKGKVVFFNNAKGWGFIKGDDRDRDLFCHYTAIIMDGYRELKQDQIVEYEIGQGPNGEQACNVKIVKD